MIAVPEHVVVVPHLSLISKWRKVCGVSTGRTDEQQEDRLSEGRAQCQKER